MTKKTTKSGKAKAVESVRADTAKKTKLARLVAMLQRPEGATIPQLMKALDWQAHSVRGAISGTLKKKQGLTVDAAKAEGQDRVYKIVG